MAYAAYAAYAAAMINRCNARSRAHGGQGLRCMMKVRRPGGRCRRHGGLSAGPRFNNRGFAPAARAGFQAWLLRRKEAKARGEYVPKAAGRIAGRRPWEPVEISRARETVKRELKAAETKQELFDALDVPALRIVKQILELDNDIEAMGNDLLMQHRRFTMQLNAADNHLARRIKVDETALRVQQQDDMLEILRAKMETAQKKIAADDKKTLQDGEG